MALTIDDIYDKEFALKGGGYDRNDVDQFLDEICDEMTNMLEHIEKLESDLKQAQMEVEAAKAAVQTAQAAAPVVVKSEPVARTSETLEGILLSAQRLADEAVANAKSKAEDIVKEAQEKAEKIVDDAKAEKDTLGSELNTLRKTVTEYKAGFLTMLDKYKKMLENEKL